MSSQSGKHGHASTRPEKTKKVKTVKLRHHHAKPYRKRHLGVLGILLVVGVFLLVITIQYWSNIRSGADRARNFIEEFFQTPEDSTRNVSSTLGFSLDYDARKYFASAIDANTGDIQIGGELDTVRAYNTVRISPSWVDEKPAAATFTLTYHDSVVVGSEDQAALDDIEKLAFQSQVDVTKVKKGNSKDVTVGGKTFRESAWTFAADTSLGNVLTVRYKTYAGIVDGKAITILLNYGFSDDGSTLFDDVVESIAFGSRKEAFKTIDQSLSERRSSSLNILNTLSFTALAKAAGEDEGLSTEKLSALYSPAVVKIYNLYCMDIQFDGAAFARNVCSGGTGSGFFVSGDGYVATNGHVASSNPKDAALDIALVYASAGNDTPLQFLIEKSGLTEADLSSAKTEAEATGIIFDKIYQISDSRFTTTNNVTNLLVGLNKTTPDTEELITLTENLKEYPEQEDVKRAELKAVDYRLFDGMLEGVGFKASDVALLKIEGSGYPVMKMGSITGVSQGSSISILGFPGIASSNGIVDSDESVATLTSGKVSSIKNVEGNGKKVIETDTTIGHGNSGGPALDDEGRVIGVATYTLDGGGAGDGTFNYIRDVQDIIDLASNSSISLADSSTTQAEWEKGINAFFESRYSKSIKSFTEVKALYPQHPRADEFIASAEEHIKNGEDVRDLPLGLIAAAGVVVLMGIGVTVFVIVRHKKAHNSYAAHVATGAMQPMTPATPPQTMPVAPPTSGSSWQQGLAPAPAPQEPSQPAVAGPTQPPAPTPQPAPAPAPAPVAEDSQTPPPKAPGGFVGGSFE